ncbi:MAG: type I restriction-modification system subunit M [Calditrichaeota bacterium]|nr:type I restriction-modification system subunit M [Calditrichota bacterium]
MNKQQLAAKIWESANQMRSKIEANEYKDYILGFIFYKYLSDKQTQFAIKEGGTQKDIESLSEDDAETMEHFRTNIGYFISYNDLFSTWIAKGRDFDVSNVRDALSAFSRLINPRHRKIFDGIFDTLQTGLSKLGDTAGKQTKAISKLIHLIKDIPMDGKQGYDVLGFIYEYLIGMFAANAGKKAGEFYTPHEVSVLMSEIVAHHLRDKKEIQIYDPTSGSGSLLINIGQSVARHMDDKDNIKYFAQELKINTYNLTRMNLVMRGILVDNIQTRNGDTLEEDWPYFDENDPVNTYNPLYVDAVVSNPPYSQPWNPSHKEADPRYARFGLAPKSKADYAFLLHDLYHIKPHGIMTIVLPHGVLFRGGDEGKIRRNLIEQNHIDTIIGLPANIFFGTGIPTIIMVLKQKRDNSDILIVDASKGFEKVGKNNQLRASDIKRITDTVIGRSDVEKYSRKVSRDEIRENEYNLNIPRYVDSSKESESWDLYSSMFGGIPKNEIDELHIYWEAFPSLRKALFSDINAQYVELNVNDAGESIHNDPDVINFKANFSGAFDDFDKYLKKRLIAGMERVSLGKEKALLSDKIFDRLSNIPLIDRYEAYQILDDDWNIISEDLEMIQTEGFSAVTQVDPNLVIKKKEGKDQEVQEGWRGHILPFELVQETLLKNEKESIAIKEDRLLEIAGEIESVLESLSEEDKDRDAVNEAGDGFAGAALKKECKQVKADMEKGERFEDDSYERKILSVETLLDEEASLKKEIKAETAALHLKTKETIEGLSDNQVHDLLERKWITPLIDSLHKLPENIIDNLTSRVRTLAEKYAVTYKDLEAEIHETEESLISMMDELTGSEHDMQGLKEFQTLLRGK